MVTVITVHFFNIPLLSSPSAYLIPSLYSFTPTYMFSLILQFYDL